MGCCFSHDASNEELGPHRPETYYPATNSFQPYVVRNDNIIVSPPPLQAHNSRSYHAPTTTNRSRQADRSRRSQGTISSNIRKTYPEVNNRFQPSVTSSNNRTASSSSLRAHKSNSNHAPISTISSRLDSSQCIDSKCYPSYSLVKTVRSSLHNTVLKLTSEWEHTNASSEFELCLLLSNTNEYNEILMLFKKTTQKHFAVDQIYRVQNPYLWGCYLLKKQEMESRYGYVSEEYLFHGTKLENRDNICKNNFDWRRHGKSVGNIFGQGVSFSPISCYASHYSDERNSERMMIVSKVLIAAETIGNRHMKIPPVFDSVQGLRYDTATKENRHVIVKFADNEFYPSYVIYYTGQYVKKEQIPMRF